MKKVVIVFEDVPGGAVKVEVTPNVATLMAQINSGELPSAAEAYALRALRSVREDAKNEGQKKGILTVQVPAVARI